MARFKSIKLAENSAEFYGDPEDEVIDISESDLNYYIPWIKKANVRDAEVIVDFDYPPGDIYHFKWEDGIWIDGVWEYGVWYDGVWMNGVWEDGDWQGGTWHDGIWEGGRWMDKFSTWKGGTWKGGDVQ